MKASMQDEYAVRLALENMLYLVLPLTYIFISYLESLGVIPNRKNVQMIKKEIPLRHIKLTAAFKSRGGLEDMFYVQNVEVRFASHPQFRRHIRTRGGGGQPKLEGRHLWRQYVARSLFAEMVDQRLGPVSFVRPVSACIAPSITSMPYL